VIITNSTPHRDHTLRQRAHSVMFPKTSGLLLVPICTTLPLFLIPFAIKECATLNGSDVLGLECISSA